MKGICIFAEMSDKIKILIAPNSYKESADSVTAAELFYSNLKDLDADFFVCPLSDGGDGFLKVVGYNKKLEIYTHKVSVPWKYLDVKYAADKLSVPFGYNREEKTVYIESAEVIGMKLIPSDKRKPFYLSTEGLGELLFYLQQISSGSAKNILAINPVPVKIDIQETYPESYKEEETATVIPGEENAKQSKSLEIKKVVIGIGGTGTMDAGLGVLSAFGLRLYDKDEKLLPVIPCNYQKTDKAVFTPPKLNFAVELIIDVNNELLGPDGGIKVYSLQKGSTPEEIEDTEKGIRNIMTMLPINVISGAGGGLQAGVSLLTKVIHTFSTQFLEYHLNIRNLLNKTDLIITGEGTYDHQSNFNKATGYIISNSINKPVFLCCGIIHINELPQNVLPLEFIKYFSSEKESIEQIEQAIDYTSFIIKKYVQKF